MVVFTQRQQLQQSLTFLNGCSAAVIHPHSSGFKRVATDASVEGAGALPSCARFRTPVGSR